ncbi:TraR/DksA C4-type zinc finger protein [Halomonas caseinilytica]|uniref:TraR/DksA C4-type zinc finger protein n=1 Tax=Halomonas caseinilytica TaxID=438744 RepID=UPI0007E5A1DE|nr:TraR/DksA C4-type zinc finger protein [Halomonas caseinilytica]SEN50641.1 transcriptional regulator, TraR/DksA family [Halomonas caseinilytica]
MSDEADLANDLMAHHHLPAERATTAECEKCGDPIPDARRQAAPWATTCIECQGILEQKAKRRA